VLIIRKLSLYFDKKVFALNQTFFVIFTGKTLAMLLKIRYLSLFLFPLMGLLACVEEYNLTIDPTGKVLIFDGFLTNAPEADTFKVATSDVVGVAGVPYVEIGGCKVSVQIESGQTVRLIELNKQYYTPATLRAEKGKRYKLRFELPNGEVYESDFQSIAIPPKIKEVRDVFNERGILDEATSTYTPTHDVYIDAQDPANERNFYLWRYIHFERQYTCKTCINGILDSTFSNKCIFRSRFHPNYDYRCLGECFDLYFSSTINIFADNNSNGQLIKDRLVAKIPLFAKQTGALVELAQYGLSADAYRFYSLLEQQVQRTGTLADTPPAPIVGNIRNINRVREPVVGYFSVSGIEKKRYFIDRKSSLNSPVQSISMNGREPNYEPFAPVDRPPVALCLPSSNRLNARPLGWPQ
jgi:hypothetical protein